MQQARHKQKSINFIVAIVLVAMFAMFFECLPAWAESSVPDDRDSHSAVDTSTAENPEMQTGNIANEKYGIETLYAETHDTYDQDTYQDIDPVIQDVQDASELVVLKTETASKTSPREQDFNPVASVSTGDKTTIISSDTIDGVTRLFLPAYCDESSIKISWSQEYSDALAWTSSAENGIYSQAPFDARTCHVAEDGSMDVYIRANNNSTSHMIKLMIVSGVKTVYINSDDPVNKGRSYIESSPDHSAKATGSVTVVSAEGSIFVQDEELTQIKGRGNSTWGAEKKPYQIKLETKASLIDGSKDNKSKTWVLLANAYDDTLLRNLVAYKTAFNIGLSDSPEIEPVAFYYDGVFRGLYLLSEKVQIGKGRIEIDEIENKSKDTSDISDQPVKQAKNVYGNVFQYVSQITQKTDDVSGGYLLELDNSGYKKERSWFKTTAGYIVVKSPEDATYEQMKYISEFFQAAIYESERVNGDISKYFDVDSLAKFFLVNEMAKNPDYMRYSSTYFHKAAGGLIEAGPVWDFDLAFGSHSYEGFADYVDIAGITDPENTFFAANKMFRDAVKRNLPLFENAVSMWLSKNNGGVQGYAKTIADAIHADEVIWGWYAPECTEVVTFATYDESIAYMQSWLDRRVAWTVSNIVGELDNVATSKQNADKHNVERIWGNYALDTMRNVVERGKFSTGGTAILVTSDGYWDALTASGLAGLISAPIVMTPSTTLADQTAQLLSKLAPTRIIVCGGTLAITQEVAEAAMKVSGASVLERCWGQDAAGTAIAIYNRAYELIGKHWNNTAFLCTDDGYWDAMSAASVSYAMHIPVLLTYGADNISGQVLSCLAKEDAVYIVGGNFAISNNVENTVKRHCAVAGRLSGQTAIETSQSVAMFGIQRGMSAKTIGIATDNGYWDALSATALCGLGRNVIVLAHDENSPTICKLIPRFLSRISRVWIFGGHQAVSNQILAKIRLFMTTA